MSRYTQSAIYAHLDGDCDHQTCPYEDIPEGDGDE